VLLTRSRLCPRPKPGSSLHLHVLGTPPAFVLSQDQTLREELLRDGPPRATRFTKSRRGPVPPERTLPPGAGGRTRACPWWDQAPASSRGDPMYTTGPGTQDGVELGTVAETPRRGRSSDGVEPGHTSRPRGRSKSAHAVEFSKTVAPLREGGSFPGRVRNRVRSRSGPMSIAPESRRWEGLARGRSARGLWPMRARGGLPGMALSLDGPHNRPGPSAPPTPRPRPD
jgi:hypothetical protein